MSELKAEDVARYLEENPIFFEEHADLLSPLDDGAERDHPESRDADDQPEAHEPLEEQLERGRLGRHVLD